MKKLKILHIITDFGPGGAQKYLSNIIKADKQNTHLIYVINPKKNFSKIKNIQIINSKFSLYFFPLCHLLELNFLINKIKPNIIQSWLYHADFLTIFINPFYKCKKIWSIRNSVNDTSFLKKSTKLILKICALFSNFIPNHIIYNSISGKLSHEALKYNKSKGLVIENGIDIDTKKLKQIKIGNNENFVIGTACRNDPAKGLNYLIEALGLLSFDDWRCIIVGENITKIKLSGNYDKIELYDHIPNIHDFYKKLDLFVLPSISEGFSNVLLESMSRGIQCIATDVGDNSRILGPNNLTIPTRDSIAIKNGITQYYQNWINNNKNLFSRKNLVFISENFSFSRSIKLHKEIWNTK